MKVLFGGSGFGVADGDTRTDELLAQEASQVFMRGDGLKDPNPFELNIPDPDADDIPLVQQKAFLQMLVERPEGEVSNRLRERAEQLLAAKFSTPTVAALDPNAAERATRKGRRQSRPKSEPLSEVVPSGPSPTPVVSPPPFLPPTPPFRVLRGFSVDPSLATRLNTAPISVVRLRVRWEEDLAPGPSGEYLEVIDYDPASRCFYAPVDLNDHTILAQDGLPPSRRHAAVPPADGVCASP